MLSVLSSCLLVLAAAQGADPAAKAPAVGQVQSDKLLDELIAKTSQLKSFTATYELVTSKPGEAPDWELCLHSRLDYQAPDKAHVDMDLGSMHFREWVVGGVLTARIEGEKSVYARIDMSALDAELSPVQLALDAAIPEANSASLENRAVISIDWSFSDESQGANFNTAVGLERAARTPLGWLTALRDRGDTPSVSDEQLVFDKDGHFKVAISRDSGFVETLEGTAPKTTIHFRLKSLDRDVAIDSKRFEPPNDPPKGDDVSDGMRKQLITNHLNRLRGFIYRGIAGTAGEAWSESERTRITMALRALNEYALNGAFTELRKWAQKRGDDFATWLHQREEHGVAADQLARDRDEQITKLNETLDKKISVYSARLWVPANSPPFPRGDELLKLEREVATKAFDELVRAPIVRDFEQATSLEKK